MNLRAAAAGDDNMEFIFGLILGLFCLGIALLPWVNLFRHNSLRREVEELRIQLSTGRQEGAVKPEDRAVQPGAPKEKTGEKPPESLIALPQPEKTPTTEPKPEKPKPVPEPRPPVTKHAAKHAAKQAAATAQLREKGGFELNVGARLPVWIGAISLIFAAFFMVKYSIEHGLISDAMRVMLGGVFGVALVAGGRFVANRPNMANSTRIAQGLVGAGLVSLYVSLYAATNLYHLIGEGTGFIGMAAVTAAAVVLSLRHGQPIAAFGMIGGLLTPALVASEQPDAIVLFSYLFVLFAGLLTIMARKGWWILALIALAGIYIWTMTWFVLAFIAPDALVLELFIIGIVCVVFAVTGRSTAQDETKETGVFTPLLPQHALNMLAVAGAFVTVFALGTVVTLDLFDWAIIGLLSLALMVMAYFQPGYYRAPLMTKLAFTVMMLWMWMPDVPFATAITVIGGLGAIYAGGAAFIMRKQADPRFSAWVQIIAVLALYLSAYWWLDIPAGVLDVTPLFWGVIAMALAGLAVWQAQDIRENYKGDAKIGEHLVAVYALAASAFISLALAIECPWEYLPMAFAGQIAATAWVFQRTEIAAIRKILMALVLLFIGINLKQIWLFTWTFLTSLVAGKTMPLHDTEVLVLEFPVMQLGISAALIAAALWFMLQRKSDDNTMHRLLFGTAMALVMAAVYYVARASFLPVDVTGRDAYALGFATEVTFFKRATLTIAMAAAGIGLLRACRRWGLTFAQGWGKWLVHGAVARFGYYDGLLMNPVFNHAQFVGDMPVVNGVTLVYGLAAVLCALALAGRIRVIGSGTGRYMYGIVGLGMLFLFATFTVRQGFHGGSMFPGTASTTEFYAYSVAWLLTGLALLGLGIWHKNKPVRMAAVGFVGLTIFKVFLFDAGELEGLYRIFSFFGLGVSLIGLSYFYTRFVLNVAAKD